MSETTMTSAYDARIKRSRDIHSLKSTALLKHLSSGSGSGSRSRGRSRYVVVNYGSGKALIDFLK